MSNVVALRKPEMFTDIPFDVFAAYNPRAYSKNSSAALSQHWKMFERHCTTRGVKSLPASPETVSEYLTLRAKTCHRNTVKQDMSQIAKVHEINDFVSPTSSRVVKETVRAISREKVMNEEGIRQASGANWNEVQPVVQSLLSSGETINIRNGAMIVCAYVGLLRSSELLGIKIKHLHLDAEIPYISLPFTKTNMSGKEDRVSIPQFAISVIQQWLDVRKDVVSEDEYLFTGVSRHGTTMKHKSGIKHNALNEMLKSINPEWTTHSFRVGASQDALNSGVSVEGLMIAGRWSNPHRAMQYAKHYSQKTSVFSEIEG